MMSSAAHTLAELFMQLGLPSDKESIEDFVDRNQSVCKDRSIVEAPIWSESQLEFLRQALSEDSDWSQIVDSLYLMLSQ